MGLRGDLAKLNGRNVTKWQERALPRKDLTRIHEHRNGTSPKAQIISFIFLFCCASAFLFVTNAKTFGIDRDYLNYIDIYHQYFMFESLEYIPSKMADLGAGLGLDFIWYYLALTSIAVFGKFYVAWSYRFNSVKFATLYAIYFFWIFDYTQVRFGAALPFLMISLLEYTKGRYVKGVVFLIVATLFHYSALLMLIPFSLAIAQNLDKRISISYAVILIISGILLSPTLLDYAANSPYGEYLAAKTGHIDQVNVINTYYLAILSVLSLVAIQAWRSSNRLTYFALYSLASGSLAYAIASQAGFPVIAQRVIEFSIVPTWMSISTAGRMEQLKPWLLVAVWFPFLYLSIYIHFVFQIIPD